MKRQLRTSIGIWIILFFLFLPFTYSILPNFGGALSNITFRLVQGFAKLFGTEISTLNFHSDSLHLYFQTAFLLILSVVFTAILNKIKTVDPAKLQLILHTSISYILAFFLLKYGIDKLLKFQFYDAAPNTLHTPVGYLSKDILFWTSMGSSHSYNIFMGLTEIIPAVLLLHSRTRMLGALIALGVLGNVLAINFGFDITVKVLSTFLVLSSLFVLDKYSERLKAVFIQNTESTPVRISQLTEKPLLKRATKGLLLSVLIIECVFTYASYDSWNGDNTAKIAYYGSYDIKVKTGSSDIPEFENVRRIHFHNSGYLIFETNEGTFNDYPIYFKSNDLNTVYFKDSKLSLEIKKGAEFYTFASHSLGNTFQMIATKIDLKKLPYHFDSFHWTVDSFAEE